MRENHNTQSYESIIIYHDELYIALTTLEEILHIIKDKYKIKINPHVYQGSNFPHDLGGTLICERKYMESYISMIIWFSKTNYLKIYILHFKPSSY